MKCIFFSDLHIKASQDEAELLFEKLCSHSKIKDSTHIFLLGDMFDLLIGEHEEYFNAFPLFFKNVIELLESGKKVLYLEGNHDFHIQKSFKQFIHKNSTKPENFKYLRSGEMLLLGDKKYYYCHGDEVDYTNKSFKRWKNIYSSHAFNMFISKILSFNMVQNIGSSVSTNSKMRGRKSFEYKKNQEKFRIGAKLLMEEKGVDGVICGHTHIQENHEYPNGKKYLNCGHPLSNKNALYFNGEDFEFINLEDS